jgi:predicted ATPase with chaperone activity
MNKDAHLEGNSQSWMVSTMNQKLRSARAYHRALKLAPTIADLEEKWKSPPNTWLKRCNTSQAYSILKSSFMLVLYSD